MNTIILDALFHTDDPGALPDGRHSLAVVCSKIDRKKYERVILLQNGVIKEVPPDVKNVVLTGYAVPLVLKTIIDEARNSQNIVVVRAGNPYFDLPFIDAMLERHITYLADYTYSVGYPDGLIPEIVTLSCLQTLYELVQSSDEVRKDYLFYSISKDINAFDIETCISPIDLRIDRISFGSRDVGEKIFTKKLFESKGAETPYDELVVYLAEHRELLFTTVYSAFFDITTVSGTQPIYYPHAPAQTVVHAEFHKLEHVFAMLAEVHPGMQIVFGGKGDPFLHPEWMKILTTAIATGFSVIIESDGYKIEETLEQLTAIKETSKITFVIKVDAVTDEVYRTVHGTGTVTVPNKAYHLLKEAGFAVYRQIVRMHENESDIELMVKNKDTENVIIRKYSTYCGRLPDRKVVDLSPVNRFGCYHLRRELAFSPDMNVNLCNYATEKLADFDNDAIIALLEHEYSQNVQGNCRECCKNCDDYYVFNF